MTDEAVSTPSGRPSVDMTGFARTGRALLAGVLEGITLGAAYGAIIAFIFATADDKWTHRAADALTVLPLGGMVGGLAGGLAGLAAALVLPILRRAPMFVVRVVLGLLAAPAPAVAYSAFVGASFIHREVLAVTLPAGVVAGLAAAATARWIVTGQLRNRPHSSG